MCGRFTQEHTWAELHEIMSIIPASAAGRNDPPRYNIAPTQDVAFLAEHDGNRVVKDGSWWLIPFWAKERPKYPTFNARSETAHEKSSFRESLKSRRCLIPASAYYEWTRADDGGKDPHYIHLPDREPFCFAGLWAHNTALDITSCTILTAAAAPQIEHLHHRMPIILRESAFAPWLSEHTSPDQVQELYTQNRGSELQNYRVGRAVNKNTAKGAELAQPIG